jgi:predicted RNase H-like HicB family nuclease
MAKDLAYYMGLDYPVEVKKIKEDEGGGFFVSVPLLPGCMSDGESLEEAYDNIQEAKEEWLSSMLERGMKIPEPVEQEEYSGKFIIRLPKTLHRALVQVSKREGVSLNQYVTNTLAYSLGQKS